MRDIGPVSWWRQWLHFFTFSICLSSHLIMAQLRNFLWNIFQIFWVIFTFFQISIKETVRWWLVCAMAGISFRIPGMDGMELSRLTNGVANLTVVLQEVIPEVTRSFVRTLDTVTNVIRPLGNVTTDLADISDKSKPSILHLHKMTEGTVKLLDTLNQGLAPCKTSHFHTFTLSILHFQFHT